MDRSREFLGHNQAMGNRFSFGKSDDPCELYDSTWEEEEALQDTEPLEYRFWSPQRSTRAAKDMQRYRRFCQLFQNDDKDDDDDDDDDVENDSVLPNVLFYKNEIHFQPDGVLIEEFHNDWYGAYDKLEYVHSYIQWIFPIEEKGMNYASYELIPKEIKLFRRDEEIKGRLLKSYKLMLDFYGIELVSEETGEVKRAENWRERFLNLNRNTHNNLRITRILKSLGLLGFHRYQKPLVHFFIEETLVNGTLPRVKQSVLDYFMFTVLDKEERKELITFAFRNFKSKEDFVWCPRQIRDKLNAHPNEGVSSDATSQSDQNDQTNSGEEPGEQIKTDSNEDTGTEHSLTSNDSNDNVSGQVTEKDSPAPAPLGVDSQHDGHRDSEDKDATRKDEDEEGNNIPNSVSTATEQSNENSSESDKKIGNLHDASEQKQGNEILEEPNEKKGDPVHSSVQDNAEDRRTDEGVRNSVISDSDENSDSTKVKNEEHNVCQQGPALGSDDNSSVVTPGKDTETGESSERNSVEDEKTDFGGVTDVQETTL